MADVTLVPISDIMVPDGTDLVFNTGRVGTWSGQGGAAEPWEGAAGPDPKAARGVQDGGGGVWVDAAGFGTDGTEQPSSTLIHLSYRVRRVGAGPGPSDSEAAGMHLAVPRLSDPTDYLIVATLNAPDPLVDDVWQAVEGDIDSIPANGYVYDFSELDWSGAILVAFTTLIFESGPGAPATYEFQDLAAIVSSTPVWTQVARPAGSWVQA